MSKGKITEMAIPLIVGALTILFAQILEKGYQSLGLELLSTGLVIVIFMILGNAFIVGVLIKSKMIESMTEQIEAVRSLVEPKKFFWLRPNCEVYAIERVAKGHDIWILSPDLANDTSNAPVIPIVKSNLARGIRYTYVVPNTYIITARIGELQEIFKDNLAQLDVKRISPQEFNLLSSTHVAIYNPTLSKIY